MSKHTPGPWEDRPQSSNAYHQIYATDGNGGLVAIVYDYCGDDTPANAKLIAASTDLLRELEHLVRLLEPLEQNGGLDVPGLATLNGAREAIAKAR
jgi:hypothetical protein